MTWNYRIFRQIGKRGVVDKKGEEIPHPDLYFLGECFYDEKGKPLLHSTVEHSLLCGDSLEDIKETYAMIGEAFDAPVVDIDQEGKFL